MFRRCILRRIGVEGGGDQLFMSAVKDKRYLEHRLAILGRATSGKAGACGASGAPDGKGKGEGDKGDDAPHQHQPLSDEELSRFTTSIGSAESLFHKRMGEVPTGVVIDEENDIVEGSSYPSPVRYGDWEYNGRCTDF